MSYYYIYYFLNLYNIIYSMHICIYLSVWYDILWKYPINMWLHPIHIPLGYNFLISQYKFPSAMTLPGSPAVGLPRDHLGAGANSLWKADLQIYKATKSYGTSPDQHRGDEVSCNSIWLWRLQFAMEAMALIEIDGLPMFTY